MGKDNAGKVHRVKANKKTVAGLKWYSPMKGGRPVTSTRFDYVDWQGRTIYWQDAAGIHLPRLKRSKGGWHDIYNDFPEFAIGMNPLSREIRICIFRHRYPYFYTFPFKEWKAIKKAVNHAVYRTES